MSKEGTRPLSETHPDLNKIWDYERNAPLTPQDVSAGSHKKVWWKCSQPHSWEMEVCDKVRGRNCPYCSGRRVLVGFNDLSSFSPQLAKEWDYERNAPLTPQNITSGSNQKVWWKCTQGHSWNASVCSRVRGNGCPYCSGQRVLRGYNDLATLNPLLAKEWDCEKNSPLTPSDISIGSRQKVWWKCAQGHSWNAVVSNRSHGSGCPFCYGKIVIPGINDIETKNVSLASELHPTKNGDLKPSDIAIGSSKKVWWLGSCGHEWESTPKNRASGNGCPFCSGRIPIVGVNDLQTLSPIVAKEWDYDKNKGLLPSDFTNGSSRKVWWKCSKGHSWKTSIAHRTTGEGCPICRGEKSTSFPEQAILYYVKKLFFDAKNRYKPQWLRNKDSYGEIDIFIPSIKVGIEYDGFYYHVNAERDIQKDNQCNSHGIKLYRIREPKCPELNSTSICINIPSTKGKYYYESAIIELIHILSCEYNKSLESGVNIKRDYTDILNSYEHLTSQKSVALIDPYLVEEWDLEKNGNITPYNTSYGSARMIWWKCKNCGNSWQDSPKHRHKGRGCPNCAKEKRITTRTKKRLEEVDSFQTWCFSHGEYGQQLLNEWSKDNTILPTDITYGSSKPVNWVCSKCGSQWMAPPGRRIYGSGCLECSYKKRGNESRKGPDEFEKELNRVNPTILLIEPYIKANKKIKVRCSVCNYEWKAIPNSLISERKTGCPACAVKRVAEKSKKRIICKETGVIYSSIKEAAQATGCLPSSISHNLNGKYGSAGGFHWEYLSNG